MSSSTALGSDAVVVARLSWDAASSVDVDLQAIIVDTRGRIIDAAYYNNMKCGKAVVHSGDEGGEAGRDSREEVRITFPQVQANVHMIIVLATCFTGGSLRDAPGAVVAMEQLKPAKRPLGQSSLSGSTGCGVILSAFARSSSGGWHLRSVNEQLPTARHFMDCLDELNRHIVAEIPTANRRQKVAFAMEKGEVLDFGSSLQTVTLGLGWDVDQGEIDLDASAVIFDNSSNVLESVFFGNLRSCLQHSSPGAVVHSGDNLTGAGDGDDEQITVQLSALGDSVHDVFFCIHIYSKGRGGRPKTFREVANPYCRVVEGTAGDELCRYTLTEAGDRSGLIIARLRRSPDGRWGFNAMGIPSKGTMYKDSIGDMQRMTKVDPRTLQRADTKALRSQPTLTLEGAPEAAHVPLMPVIAEAPASDSKACCSVQ
mmetsp:Transcript_16707/g.30823  ORF Transcript_16707/g.30823 Transcript_16707/m.30823 type:complete len:427 (-) Transcript_16707:80-1360(-)